MGAAGCRFRTACIALRDRCCTIHPERNRRNEKKNTGVGSISRRVRTREKMAYRSRQRVSGEAGSYWGSLFLAWSEQFGLIQWRGFCGVDNVFVAYVAAECCCCWGNEMGAGEMISFTTKMGVRCETTLQRPTTCTTEDGWPGEKKM